MTARTRDLLRFGTGVLAFTALSCGIWLVAWITLVPLVGGWSPVTVTSGSMEPAISVGDVVLTESSDATTPLDQGAIIVFDDPAGEGLVTHRVVGITEEGDYVTRGDANAEPDSTPVRPESVRGVGQVLVPAAGLPAVWAQQGAWLELGALLFAMGWAAHASRWAISARHDPWRPEAGRSAKARPRRRLAGALAGVATIAVLSVVTATTPALEATASFTDVTSSDANSVVVDPWKYIIDLDTGTDHTCLSRTGLGTWCAGHNNQGQLGDNTTTDRRTPIQVLGPGGVGFLGDVETIGGGTEYTCGSKLEGSVWCWGRNDKGQLGDNTTADRRTPIQVLGPGGVGMLTGVRQVSTGSRHTCAVKTDNTLWCWGDNSKGQLGDNTTTERRTPVQVTGPSGVGFLTNVASVSAGDDFTCAVKADSSVWCFGNNSQGQLGDNTTTDKRTPVLVSNSLGVFTGGASVAAGRTSACVVKTDTSVWCWGDNAQGQLGDNTTTDRRVATQVLGSGGAGIFTGAVTIDVGFEHTCAVKSDSSVWCWGRNDKGQLGDDTTTDRRTPGLVSGPGGSGILSLAFVVAAGDSYGCVGQSDGTARCWGKNDKGQLGDNTTTDRRTPVDFQG